MTLDDISFGPDASFGWVVVQIDEDGDVSDAWHLPTQRSAKDFVAKYGPRHDERYYLQIAQLLDGEDDGS